MFVFFGEVVVGDAVFEEGGFDFVVVVGYEDVILVDGCFVVVGIGGYAVFHFKEVVCVAVDVGFWCGGEANEYGVEVFKYCPVFFEDAAVAFVDYDEVEVCRGE